MNISTNGRMPRRISLPFPRGSGPTATGETRFPAPPPDLTIPFSMDEVDDFVTDVLANDKAGVVFNTIPPTESEQRRVFYAILHDLAVATYGQLVSLQSELRAARRDHEAPPPLIAEPKSVDFVPGTLRWTLAGATPMRCDCLLPVTEASFLHRHKATIAGMYVTTTQSAPRTVPPRPTTRPPSPPCPAAPSEYRYNKK